MAVRNLTPQKKLFYDRAEAELKDNRIPSAKIAKKYGVQDWFVKEIRNWMLHNGKKESVWGKEMKYSLEEIQYQNGETSPKQVAARLGISVQIVRAYRVHHGISKKKVINKKTVLDIECPRCGKKNWNKVGDSTYYCETPTPKDKDGYSRCWYHLTRDRRSA